LQVLVLIGAIALDAVGLMADGRAAEPGARPVGGGGIKGCAEQHGGRETGALVAPHENLNILAQHLLKAPLRMRAGKTRPCAVWWCNSGRSARACSSGSHPDPAAGDTSWRQSRTASARRDRWECAPGTPG